MKNEKGASKDTSNANNVRLLKFLRTFCINLFEFVSEHWPAFVICLLIFLLFILPDIAFSLFHNNFSVSHDSFSCGFLAALAVFFLISKNRTFVACFTAFLALIQFGQFCHIKYFGTIITPSSIYLMTKEVNDVCGEANSLFLEYIVLLPVIILAFYGVYKLAFLRLSQRYKTKAVYPCIFFALGLFYIRHGVPNGIFFSLENSLRTVVGYVHILVDKPNFKVYKPYTVQRIREVNEPMTVVYIVGESANADHMSLFGYPQNTTPELKKLAESPNFYYTRGISSSVTTISACKFIFNAIKEPDNVNETSLDTTNLFRLAKLSGFKTFYISSKRADIISNIGGVPYMDVLITRGTYPHQFSKKRDDFLVELLPQLDLADKNFIVLHQRCVHSPYNKTVPAYFKPSQKFTSSPEARVNEYDNATLFNDSVISAMFNKFNKMDGKFYIIFASDHNELIGKNGIWGHGILDKDVAQIPVMIQSNDAEFMEEVRKIFAITHYDICCIISDLFGFKINNPNEAKRLSVTICSKDQAVDKAEAQDEVNGNDDPVNVVYILGESMNADHMSLFGYSEDTTPELKKLAQFSNFYYTRGIASAVSTIPSSRFMINATKEPDNLQQSAEDTTNLFRLAKENGFKTFYISAKNRDMVAPVGGIPYIDVIIFRGLYKEQFNKQKDLFLLELLHQQDFSKKNFIVIHQRCIHSPYGVPAMFKPSRTFSKSSNEKINKYDNAVFFNDYVISSIFNMFNNPQANKGGRFYIVFASDHNELTGEKGVWGHGMLDKDVAQIPVMVQSNDADFVRKIRGIFKITHYDICCAIANVLGFNISNPNDEAVNDPDIYYINGVDYLGRCGYIKFRKDYKNKKIEYLEKKL